MNPLARARSYAADLRASVAEGFETLTDAFIALLDGRPAFDCHDWDAADPDYLEAVGKTVHDGKYWPAYDAQSRTKHPQTTAPAGSSDVGASDPAPGGCRSNVPHVHDVVVIGPGCFAAADRSVICWDGVNYLSTPSAAPTPKCCVDCDLRIKAMAPDYRPLYAEQMCCMCGYWRGQHFVSPIADLANDDNLVCPSSTTFIPQ